MDIRVKCGDTHVAVGTVPPGTALPIPLDLITAAANGLDITPTGFGFTWATWTPHRVAQGPSTVPRGGTRSLVCVQFPCYGIPMYTSH